MWNLNQNTTLGRTWNTILTAALKSSSKLISISDSIPKPDSNWDSNSSQVPFQI